MTGNGSKVQCCKKQYCIGTWNVRSMNQGKLEVLKQEMGRLNTGILEISELKWTGMGECNSDDRCPYYCGQESLKKCSSPHSQQKAPKCSSWVKSKKWQNDLSSFPRQTIQYKSDPSLCSSQYFWRSWGWTVLWRCTRPFKTNTQKDVLFIIGDWNAKVGSQENWQGKARQIWPWGTEWSKARANRALPRKCTGHSKHILPTTQEKTVHMDITRWSTPKSDWLSSLQPKMEKLYTVNKNKTRSWLWLRSWTPYCQTQT